MSYRRKHCSFCHGDHSILDCPILPEKAKIAQDVIRKLETNRLAYREEFIVSFLATRLYTTDAFAPEDGEYVCVQKSPDPERLEWALDKLNKWYTREFLWEDVTKEEALQALSEAPDYLTLREFQTLKWTTNMNEYNARSVVSTHERNEENKRKRANKKCSYCRQSGHTVRTCKQKTADLDTYRKAYMISAYRHAKVLSRTGLWTGSMIKSIRTNEEGRNILMHWKNSWSQYSPLFLQTQREGGYEGYNSHALTTEGQSLIDFIYLAHISRVVRWEEQTLENPKLWGSTQVLSLPMNRAYYSRVADHLDDRDWLDALGNGTKVMKLFPTKISEQHIYRHLMSLYSNPRAPSSRKNQSPQIGKMQYSTVYQRIIGDNSQYDYGCYVTHGCLYEQKRRNENVWDLIASFVEENEEILNIIENWNV